MTVRAEATGVVPATSREVLEFMLDLDRYRKADTKIGRVTRPIVLDGDGVGRTPLTFRRPFRWVYEPLLRTWLQSELEAELDRVQEILGGEQ